jgi:inorganic pyrophosphatase
VHDIDPSIERNGTLRVVVETPRGSRHKYAWSEELRAFEHKATLGSGLVWPYDYGFIPRTRGGDGDPLDVLVLMDEPAFPGCILHVRIIGGFEVQKNGVTNDRYVACLLPSREISLSTDGYETLRDLPKPLLEQMENFLTTYSEQRGNEVRVTGRMQASKALARIKKSVA